MPSRATALAVPLFRDRLPIMRKDLSRAGPILGTGESAIAASSRHDSEPAVADGALEVLDDGRRVLADPLRAHVARSRPTAQRRRRLRARRLAVARTRSPVP